MSTPRLDSLSQLLVEFHIRLGEAMKSVSVCKDTRDHTLYTDGGWLKNLSVDWYLRYLVAFLREGDRYAGL